MARPFRQQTTVKMTRVIAAMRALHGLPEPGESEVADMAHMADSVADLDDEARTYRDSIRLCFLIYDVARMHRTAYDEFMKPLGITRQQWSMLAQLSRHDGVVQTRLADLLEVKKANAGVILASLEAAGWVERRDDPFDKRVKRVYLVRPAHHIIHQMSVLAGQFGNRILGSLSKAERTELGRLLVTVKHDLIRQGKTAGDGEELG